MKVGIYTRISRPDERDILLNQIRDAKDYCRQHDLDYGERVWWDVASGKDEKRPGFQEMMDAVAHKYIDLVVFTSTSRVTRAGIGTAFGILKQIESAGVGWHFVNQPILNYDSTSSKLAKDILLAVLAAVDEDFRRNISEKTKQAFTRRTKPWGHPRGVPMNKCYICGKVPHSKPHIYHPYQERGLEGVCHNCRKSKSNGKHMSSAHDFEKAPPDGLALEIKNVSETIV